MQRFSKFSKNTMRNFLKFLTRFELRLEVEIYWEAHLRLFSKGQTSTPLVVNRSPSPRLHTGASGFPITSYSVTFVTLVLRRWATTQVNPREATHQHSQQQSKDLLITKDVRATLGRAKVEYCKGTVSSPQGKTLCRAPF